MVWKVLRSPLISECMVSKDAVPMTAILGDLSGTFEGSLSGNFLSAALFRHCWSLLGKSKPSRRDLSDVFA